MAEILLVDDDDQFCETFGWILRKAGHSVTTAANGNEAICSVQDHAFDLVIIDLVMPEKEGVETIMELHRTNPALKIIAISGGGLISAPENYLGLARELGATETLAKPFSGKELLAAVASVLSQ